MAQDLIKIDLKFKLKIKLMTENSAVLLYTVTILYPFHVRKGILPWTTPYLVPSRFFINEKKINIFRLMHIALFLKVIY